ncbi:hypothetical protein BJ742DRAFT_744626 [Cladochytrium replicatum]|nr:hypothetical protein BJ742DRAFT_744626 [Cladochytrium replicatum]
MSMLDQLSNRIKEPRMEWITREDGMLVCTLCTGKDHREYKERDALRKHCRASHPDKEGLGTNPRVHTEEFLRDAFEVAGLPAAGQEGVDMVLRILQGTVKRDKDSLNNDSYEEDLTNSTIATGNLRRIALDFFGSEEFGVLLTPLWNNKVILERIDRDNNKLASFTPIPGVCVQDGFQCRGCGYVCGTLSTFQKHCCKSNPAARGTSPKQVKVQSIVMPYYGLHGYWVVQMAPLGPYSPDPSLQLTEMQKASLQLLLADAFTSVPALKLSEELPPWILGCDFHHVDPRHRSGQKINECITWKDVVGEQNQDIGLGFNRKELGKTMVAYHKALQSRIMRMPFMVRQEIMKPRFDQEQQVNEKQKFRQLRDATLSRYAQTWTCVLWLTILVWKRIIETPFVQISSSLGASLEQFARMLKQKVGNSGPEEPTGIPLFDLVGDQGLDVAQLLSGDTNHEDEVDSEESSSESGDEDQESPVGPTHLLPVGSAAETGEELFAALLAVTESLFQAETVISTIPEKVFNNPLFTWWVIDSRDVLGAWRPANSVSRTGAALLRWAYVTGLHRFWQDCKVTGSVEPERLMQIGHFTSRFNRHTMSGRIGVTLAWIKKVASQTIATNRMQFDSQACAYLLAKDTYFNMTTIGHAYSTLIRDLSLLMKKIAYPLQPDQETWLTLSWLIENAPDVTCETASDYEWAQHTTLSSTHLQPALGGILASWVRNIGPVTDHHDLWQQHGQLLEWNKKIAAAVLLGCGAPPRLTDLVAQNAVNSSAVPRSVYHKNDRLVLVSYRCKTEQIKEERTVVPRFVPRSLERLLIFHLFIVRRLLFSTFKWVQKKTFPEECRRSLFLGKNGTLECSDLSTTLTETFQSILGVRVTYAEYRRFASNFSQIDSRLMPAQVSTLLRKGDMGNLGEGHSSHTAEAIYNRTGSSIPQLLDVVAAERLRICEHWFQRCGIADQEHEQLVPAVTSPEAVLRSGDRSNVSETVRDTAKVSETETVLGTLTVSEVLETVNVHATFREDFLASGEDAARANTVLQATELLRTFTGNRYAHFRSDSIREAICKSEKHTLLVSPTGSGKTVVPAILAALNTAVLHVLISPLRAVAAEIRKRLEELRIPCYLWSEVKAHKYKLNAIAGHPGLLLCQVEQLDNPGLLSTELVQIWENGRLGTVILDECNILLTQRHFREAMTNVKEFVHKSKYASRPLGSCRFLYMTATMPVVLQSAFEQQVGLGRGELSVCRSPTDRPELAYFVKSWPLAEVCEYVRATCQRTIIYIANEEQQAQIKSLLLGGPSAKEAVPTNMHPCCHHGSKMSELDRNVDLCRWLGWEGLDQGRDPIAAMADMSRVMIATSGLGAALNVDDVGLVVIVSCSGMMELSQMGGRAARNGSVGIEILIRNEGFMHVRTEEELSPDRAALLEYMQTSSCLRRAKITFLDGNPNAPECRNSCAKLCGNCGGQSNLYLKLGQQQETPPGQQYSGTLFSSTSSTTTSTQSDVSRVPETPRIIRTQTPNYWDSPTPLYGPPGATQPLGTYHERPFLIKPIPNRGTYLQGYWQNLHSDSFSGHHFGKQRSSSSSYTLKNQKDYEESPSSSSYTMKNQMDYEENPSGLSLKRPKVWIPVLTLVALHSSVKSDWSWSHPEDGSVQWLPADVGSTQSKWRTFTTEHKPNDFQQNPHPKVFRPSANPLPAVSTASVIPHLKRDFTALYHSIFNRKCGCRLLQVPQQHGVTIVAGSAENRDIVGLTVLQRRR